MKKKDNTLLEMLAAILVFGVIAQIILLIAFDNRIYNAIGLWVGVFISGGMVIHMKRTIEDAIDIGGGSTDKKMRADSAKRMAIVAIVIAVVFYFNWGNPLTVLLGIFALKISAYAQPVVHKLFCFIEKRKIK